MGERKGEMGKRRRRGRDRWKEEGMYTLGSQCRPCVRGRGGGRRWAWCGPSPVVARPHSSLPSLPHPVDRGRDGWIVEGIGDRPGHLWRGVGKRKDYVLLLNGVGWLARCGEYGDSATAVRRREGVGRAVTRFSPGWKAFDHTFDHYPPVHDPPRAHTHSGRG